MDLEKRIVAILAHPDDAEFMCAGTLSLFRNRGWEVHIVTMTPGDKGSAVHTREEISRPLETRILETSLPLVRVGIPQTGYLRQNLLGRAIQKLNEVG